MKRFLIYIFSGILLLVLADSCNKALEVKPTHELEDGYFNTEDHIQRGIGAVYAKLTDLYTYNNNAPDERMWLLPGDDLFSNNPYSFDNFSGLNGSAGELAYVWQALYQVVNRANTMLEKINENQSVYTTPGLLNYNKGEMLFLRGWAFYKLWSWWGKAPVVTSRIVGLGDHLYSPPSEGHELLDTAVADLSTASGLLPAAWPADQTGRVTKDAAWGMLVKCYVTLADYDHQNADDYQKALEAFSAISSSRKLVGQYGENFDYRFENNTESLFEFQASESAQENPFLGNDFGEGTGSMGAFYQFFENSWTNLGTLIGPTQKLVDAFDPLDPRKNETFQNTTDPAWSFDGGYKFVKYINGDRNKYVGIAAINSINNYRILRLADVKLLAAEAFLQTGQTANALTEVNDIRSRARKSTPDGVASTQPAALSLVTMQDIMHERFVELAGEANIRWDDLRRWNAAGFVDLASWTKEDFGFPPTYSPFKFDAKVHVLMPIPTSEMDANPKMLAGGQNPGY